MEVAGGSSWPRALATAGKQATQRRRASPHASLHAPPREGRWAHLPQPARRWQWRLRRPRHTTLSRWSAPHSPQPSSPHHTSARCAPSQQRCRHQCCWCWACERPQRTRRGGMRLRSRARRPCPRRRRSTAMAAVCSASRAPHRPVAAACHPPRPRSRWSSTCAGCRRARLPLPLPLLEPLVQVLLVQEGAAVAPAPAAAPWR